MSDTQSGQADISAMQADDFFGNYLDSIVKEMGLDTLSDEDKSAFKEKIALLVHKRFINTLMIYLPEDKAREIGSKADQMAPDELINYLMENVPSAPEKIAEELKSLKDELIGDMRK